MAVVANKSTLVTNADATTQTFSDVTVQGGRVRSAVATVEVANGDSIASTYRMFRIASNARVEALRLYCDAITSAAADIGLYQTAANGGAVVDVDAYASAQSLATAITTAPPNVAFEARDVASVANRVWQDAGASVDSQRTYDIAVTLTAAATASGTVTMVLHYVVD